MISLTLKNLPPELYDRLKDSAKLHRRSLNGEVIHHLENALMARRLDPEDFIKRLDALHAKFALPPLTGEFIEDAINEGRP